MPPRRLSNSLIRAVAGASFALALATNASADPTPTAQIEIDYLLAYVAASQCTFIRNGTSYTPIEARDHLAQKLSFARSRITTTEEFIKNLATQSSMLGTPYIIRCGKTEKSDAPAGAWLAEELKRYRAKH
jgi:hypothetical protein